jgi:ribosome-binding protein aMBF1 (putative translation factor)
MWAFNHKKLQQAIKESDMSIQDLYKKVGISDTILYSIKNGRIEISKLDLFMNIINTL